jgi:hypothetical protein
MARKFLTPIDLGKLELQNARVQNLSTAQKPANPVEGQIYYDTDDKVVKTWNGTAWINASQGTQGTTGAQGTQGTVGAQGTLGTQGLDGSNGTQGTDGAQGTQGTDGTQGTQGTDGTQGTQGLQGLDGIQGTQGTEGQQGVQGTEGQQGTQGTEGAQGTQGTEGAQGLEGTQGTQGAEGNFGGITVVYNYDDTVTMSDPGDNNARFNNANKTLVTRLALDDNPADGNYDVSNFLQTIDDSTSTIKGHVKVSRKFDTATFYLYTISGVTDTAPNWFDVEVAYVSGQGAFTDGEELLFTFARTGDVGAQGTQGTDGAQGVQGTVGAQGVQGTLGAQGTQGTQGVQGVEGQQGTQGTVGSQGTIGSQGTVGAQGTTGSQGTQGTAALWNFTGAYNGGLPYAVGDVATYQGQTWYRKHANGGNLGDTPSEGTFWTLLAAQGVQGTLGSQGTEGTQGVQGTEGQQGVQGTEGSQGTQGTLGAQGTQGTEGAQGLEGTQGAQGAEGSFGGITFNYYYDNATNSSAPANTYIKFNSALSTATVLRIDDNNIDNTDIHTYLQTIDDSTSTIKGHVKVSKRTDVSKFALYTISALTDSATHFDIDVAFVSGNGTLSDDEDVLITFARTGDVGAQGTQGTEGAQGVQGTEGAQGVQGTLGAQGTQGTQGVQGVEGVQGVQGTEGAQGVQGTEGSQGTQGTDGTQGAQGTEGQQGTQGTDGTQGVQGTEGAQGTQGTDGTQGTVGATFPTYFAEINDPSGIATDGSFVNQTATFTVSGGPDGYTSPNRVTLIVSGGTASYTGYITGVTPFAITTTFQVYIDGYTGTDTGSQTDWYMSLSGIKGIQGTTGAQGTQGTEGAQGTQGTEGQQGVQGTEGQQGTQGTEGAQGVQGTLGAQGTEGHSDRYKTTSTTSRSIAVANNVSFVLADPDLSYSVGQDVVVAYDVNNNMSATVVSYTSGTNTLVVNVNDVRGSGTYAVWSINLDGATGVQGTTGAQGTQGTDGTQGTQGVQGLDGIQGTQGTDGAQGTQGTDGTQGTQGTDGTQGIQGTLGTQGTSGQLGTYAQTITGDSTDAGVTGTTAFTVTHGLGTTDIMVTVWDTATKMEVVTDVAYVTTTTVTIGFAVAPITTKSYRVVVKA